MPQDLNGKTEETSDLEEAVRSQTAKSLLEAREKGREWVERLQTKTDDALHTVGGKFTEMASQIDHSSLAQGQMRPAVHGLAEGLRSGGAYLAQNGTRDIREDMTEFVRRHPQASMLAALFVGFLMGSAVRRR